VEDRHVRPALNRVHEDDARLVNRVCTPSCDGP
jgi:hypothetical protein